jgi:RNA polymerase sigma-54 factor
MAQSAKLQLRQTQGLALTPQLMQSINLLQMSSLELNNFVQNEIVNNPLLEINESAGEFPEERRDEIVNKNSTEISESRKPLELDGRSSEWNTDSSEFQGQTSNAPKIDQKSNTNSNSQSNSISTSGKITCSRIPTL